MTTALISYWQLRLQANWPEFCSNDKSEEVHMVPLHDLSLRHVIGSLTSSLGEVYVAHQ